MNSRASWRLHLDVNLKVQNKTAAGAATKAHAPCNELCVGTGRLQTMVYHREIHGRYSYLKPDHGCGGHPFSQGQTLQLAFVRHLVGYKRS
jgi:hypothetical protein